MPDSDGVMDRLDVKVNPGLIPETSESFYPLRQNVDGRQTEQVANAVNFLSLVATGIM